MKLASASFLRDAIGFTSDFFEVRLKLYRIPNFYPVPFFPRVPKLVESRTLSRLNMSLRSQEHFDWGPILAARTHALCSRDKVHRKRHQLLKDKLP